MDCPRLAGCPFFNAPMSPQLKDQVEELKDRFCRGEPEACARYQVAEVIGGERVPPLMLPTDQAGAKRILKREQGE